MKKLVLIALLFFAQTISAEYNKQLYDSVISGDYDHAASIAKRLHTNNDSELQETISKLISDKIRNLVDFSYRLWTTGSREIITDNFPIQFRLFYNDRAIKITDAKYGYSIKLTPGQNKAIINISDNTNVRSSWVFKPLWESNKLYFKIWNADSNSYLEFGEKDANGIQPLIGSDRASSERFQWYLVPDKNAATSEIFFYIYNRKFNDPIEINLKENSNDEHQLFGELTRTDVNFEHYGWNFEPL
ncbi:low molecular 30 kDa lipoprotein PBMHPC-19-like [Bombyx mandarina]|uniref:Low molecular 30 kDa lipoprotein PBMHPC-19-like n=1 Tax=Bombyx mandarina TaxID=7092 RepID=A0A6J2JIJ4_BOMMA|nr:low molecular 30 kDa lipoprotein PBMHPC-19-like [Bombyx mandarina]